jgi:ribosome-associated protein
MRRRRRSAERTRAGSRRSASPRRRRFAELAGDRAPERLVDAIVAARHHRLADARQLYVGKLMRSVDPAPIERRLDAWAQGHAMDTAQQHALERWRDRLLVEPEALDALAAQYPTLDRPRFRSLIAKARTERERASPPHAYRELFRELKALAAADS